MSPACARLRSFLDGLLDARAQRHFRRHLGNCEACGQRFLEMLQLEVLARLALDDVEARERAVAERRVREDTPRPGSAGPEDSRKDLDAVARWDGPDEAPEHPSRGTRRGGARCASETHGRGSASSGAARREPGALLEWVRTAVRVE
ncbi:hypothetical protein JGU66_14720 [Myxococcaceae bacterium JPH2]|nr:hypothetical protein [Myxococcaceae bacterium JPH2]